VNCTCCSLTWVPSSHSDPFPVVDLEPGKRKGGLETKRPGLLSCTHTFLMKVHKNQLKRLAEGFLGASFILLLSALRFGVISMV